MKTNRGGGGAPRRRAGGGGGGREKKKGGRGGRAHARRTSPERRALSLSFPRGIKKKLSRLVSLLSLSRALRRRRVGNGAYSSDGRGWVGGWLPPRGGGGGFKWAKVGGGEALPPPPAPASLFAPARPPHTAPQKNKQTRVPTGLKRTRLLYTGREAVVKKWASAEEKRRKKQKNAARAHRGERGGGRERAETEPSMEGKKKKTACLAAP